MRRGGPKEYGYASSIYQKKITRANSVNERASFL
jgi:hypothetical protein